MSHPVNQLFYVLGVLFLFLILMEAINLIAIQPRARKTVATVTKIRLRSAEDIRHAGPFSGKQKRKKNMAYVTYSVDGRSYFSHREIPVSADKDIGSQVTVWYAVLFPDTLIDPPSYVKLVLFTLLSLLMFFAGFLL